MGNGNKYADALLGKLCVGSDLFGEFRNEGFDHLFKAERNGSEFAAYTLGKYFMEGKVVKKDLAKAIEHLEIASARGILVLLTNISFKLGHYLLFCIQRHNPFSNLIGFLLAPSRNLPSGSKY